MTPRCFAAWARGRSRAAERAMQDSLAQAYQTAVFYRVEKLKPLDFYLKKTRPKRKARTPGEMFAAMLQFQAGGAPISIKQVN